MKNIIQFLNKRKYFYLFKKIRYNLNNIKINYYETLNVS